MVATVGRKKAYTAECVRSGGWWSVHVPEVKGVHTQARRLDQVEAMAREAISLILNVRADSFNINVESVLPENVRKELDHVHQLRKDADRVHREAVEASVLVARDLVSRYHMTVRDAGRLLGLSHQRVAQLCQGSVGDRHSPAA